MTLALTSVARPRSVALGCGVAFTCYAAASLPMHPQGAILLGALVGSFILGFVLRDLFWIWVAFASFLAANLALHLYEDAWGVYGNPNYFGCALAIGLASALVYRLWAFLPVPLVGLWLTQSRGAILGASAALFIWLWPRYKVTAFALAALGLVAILGSSHSEAAGIWQRFGIWQDTLNHLTVFGSGWASFFDAYWDFQTKTNVGFARASHAYNDYLELIFELGIGAIFLWAFVIQVMSNSKSEAKLVIYTYGVMALTFFPLYVWPIGPLVAMTLGNLVRDEWQQ